MLETSTRLLSLLGLLQSRPHWSGRSSPSVSRSRPRTVRRDVERLRRLGYPVDATPGVAGGYRLRAGATLPPLLLDDEEAVAIAVGLRTAVSGGIAGIGETSVRALSKLEALLPDRVRRRVQAVGAATVPYPASGPVVDPEVLLAIATALPGPRALRFSYRSHDGELSRRLVRAPRPRAHRAALVSGRLGHRAGGLAHVSCRPDRLGCRGPTGALSLASRPLQTSRPGSRVVCRRRATATRRA